MTKAESRKLDELCEAFFPITGDWRENNWREILQILLPSLDQENLDLGQLGLIAGWVKGSLRQTPQILEFIETQLGNFELDAKKFRRELTFASHALDDQSLSDWNDWINSIETLFEEACRDLDSYVKLATVGAKEIDSTLYKDLFGRISTDKQTVLHKQILKGLESPRDPILGLPTPNTNRRRALIVHTCLFFFADSVHNELCSYRDIHSLLAQLDTTNTFTDDIKSDNWKANQRCIADTCHKIGLDFQGPGNPGNSEN